MLLLLLRNMMWAAWWPYATMLLAMEKATQQRERDASRPQAPAPQSARADPPPQRAESPQRDSVMGKVMGHDAFTRPEMPEPLREMMKLGIAQAQRAFDTFVATSERAWKSLESASPRGRAGLFALNAKIAEITRKNAEANFALVMRRGAAKDLPEALELQNQHMKQQTDVFVTQLEEMRDLTAQIVQQVSATRSDNPTSPPSAQDNVPISSGDARFASYAPSSSFTPGGGPGRGY